MSPGSQKAGTVDAADVERFERDGYLVIDSVDVPEETLDSIVADLRDLFGGEMRKEDGVLYQRNRIMDAWRINDHVKALALAPNVLAILEELYGRRPLPFQTLNFRAGTQQAPHSDALHFNSMPAGLHVRRVGGAGGHRHGQRAARLLPGQPPAARGDDAGARAAPPTGRSTSTTSSHVAAVIEREGLEPAYGTIEKGQALVWASNLLHGGRAAARPRAHAGTAR